MSETEAPMDAPDGVTGADSAPPHAARFPVLWAVLDEYFVAADRSQELIELYWQYGETRSEFEGLSDELADAVRHPTEAAEFTNAVLGTNLTRSEARQQLAEQRDILLRQGAASPEAVEEALEVDGPARTRLSETEVIDGSFRRTITIPIGPLKGKTVRLWHLFVAGGVLVGLGAASMRLPLPSWMLWLPLVVVGIGVLLVFVTGIGMLSLRTELRNTGATTEDSTEDPSTLRPRLSDRVRNFLT